MDRRDFLRSTGALAATAAGCAAAATSTSAQAAGDQRTYTFSCPWVPHHAGLADDAHRLARQIESALAGAISFDIKPGLTAPADFSIAPVGSDASLHPAFAYFGGLPGHDALAPSDLDTWITAAGGQDLWDELAVAHGFKPLLAGHTGSNPVLWSKVPIVALEDLAGLAIVVRGLDAGVARALGATPVAGGEMHLEAALIAPETSAAVWGSLVQSDAAGLPQRFPYGLRGALGSGGSALALKISLPVWQNLSAAEQMTIANIAHAAFRNNLADIETTSAPVESAIVARHGTVLSRPTPEFTAAVSRIAAAVVAHTAAHDALSVRVDRSYTAYRHALASRVVHIS
jgi:TRAP-type mannitol/chloroaromatic compound transport system substrate-binding protein